MNQDIRDNNDDESSHTDEHSRGSPRAGPHATLNARDHTYLPGVCHALGSHPEDTGNNGGCITHEPFWLICWQTAELVVLPGATLPLRIEADHTRPSHQRALEKLQQQIHKSRTCPGQAPTVTLGIWSVLPESSSLPSRHRRQRPSPIASSGNDDDDDSSSSSSSNSSGTSSDSEQQRQRQQRRLQQRHSWTRLGMGPNRLRRLSERVQQELNNVDWQEIAAVAGDNSSDIEDNNSGDDNDETPGMGEIVLPQQEEPFVMAGGEVNDDSRHNVDDDDDDEDRSATDPPLHPAPAASNNNNHPARRKRRRHSPPDPWHGQIGTLVTITFTHEEEPSTEDQQYYGNTTPSLILTAKAIGRFRIIHNADSERNDPYMHARRFTSGHLTELLVEEWTEKPLPMATISKAMAMGRSSNGSYASSLWQPCFRQCEPSALVQKLVDAMEDLPFLSGSIHKESSMMASPLDPVSFSYWLASNVPSLRLDEKLRILQMPTAAERLLYLLHVLDQLRTVEAVLHCGHCSFPLARARQVFTIGGADGTTGAYVNPHGIVHETLTVRQLDLLQDDADLWLLGGPEIRDSWFPGYAWTIANCALCGFHLGWKFDQVGGGTSGCPEDSERPRTFFGLRAGQIHTQLPAAHPESVRTHRHSNQRSATRI